MDRKLQITNRLIASVREYFDAFHHPIGMNVLSAKYSRALAPFGGFPECIDELHTLGLIQISMRESGGKDVWPARIKPALGEHTVLLKR